MAESNIREWIKLVEITKSEITKPGESRPRMYWKVTWEYKLQTNPPSLTATWYVDPDQYPEDALLPLTRHWLNGLCGAIASQTQDWHLEAPQIEAMKRPQSKPR